MHEFVLPWLDNRVVKDRYHCEELDLQNCLWVSLWIVAGGMLQVECMQRDAGSLQRQRG